MLLHILTWRYRAALTLTVLHSLTVRHQKTTRLRQCPYRLTELFRGSHHQSKTFPDWGGQIGLPFSSEIAMLNGILCHQNLTHHWKFPDLSPAGLCWAFLNQLSLLHNIIVVKRRTVCRAACVKRTVWGATCPYLFQSPWTPFTPPKATLTTARRLKQFAIFEDISRLLYHSHSVWLHNSAYWFTAKRALTMATASTMHAVPR